MAWGASPEEWAHFSLILGLTADLLPVVSNPHATISPLSKLKSLGKTPSRYDANRQVVGIAKWTSLTANDALINQWSQEPDYGICIQTRNCFAIDCDIEDREGVSLIESTARRSLGVGLAHRSRDGSARILLVGHVPGGVTKQVAHTPFGNVELLGTGQQFIAAGTHPSGSRYRWVGAVAGTAQLPERVPLVERAALDAFWRELTGAGLDGDGAARVERARAATSRDSQKHPDDEVARWLETRGWSRGWGRRGELRVACPWSIDHTGDSGDTETVWYPAGTGGFEQGHFVCLHAHCAARSDAEFLEAVGWGQKVADEFADEGETPVSREKNTSSGDTGVQGVSGVGPSREGPAGSSPSPPVSPTTVARRAHQDTVSAGNGATPASWLGPPGQGLKRNRNGWEPTIENVCRAIDTVGWWLELGRDTFKDDLMVRKWGTEAVAGPLAGWRALTEADMTGLRRLLEIYGFAPVGRELARDSVADVGARHEFDSAQVWLTGLVWDGVPRCEALFERYFGAVGEPGYLRAVSRYFCTGLAGRVMDPGCQADMIPVLVSRREGVGKTRGLEALAPFPEAYVTADLSVRDADLARRMRGKLIVELNELRGLNSRDSSAINSWVTERRDVWVPKYQEKAHVYARRAMVAGSTNDFEFLEAGGVGSNRRWLPFEVRGGEGPAAIRADMAQIWAEALCLWKAAGGIEWQGAFETGQGERELYEIGDLWVDLVRRWIDDGEQDGGPGRGGPYTLADVALAIGVDPRQTAAGVWGSRRLGRILREAGYVKIRARGQKLWVKGLA